MTPNERVLSALHRKKHDRVPWIEGIVGNGIASSVCGEKINVDWSVAPDGFPIQKGEELAEEQKKVNRVFGKDNIQFCAFAPVFCDKMAPADDGSPVLVGDGKIKSRDDFDKLFKLPEPEDSGFIGNAEAFINAKEDYCAIACVRLGIGATLLSMGIEAFSYAMFDDPQLIKDVHSGYADWTSKVVKILEDIGFDVIWSFDDVAFNAGPVFSPVFYQENIFPAERDVVADFTKPLITHSDGNMMPLLDSWVKLGQKAIHPIQPDVMDIDEVRRKLPENVGIIGNIFMDTLVHGNPDDISKLVKTRMDSLKKTGNYIISSSNSLTDNMKPENVAAMISAIKKYGNY